MNINLRRRCPDPLTVPTRDDTGRGNCLEVRGGNPGQQPRSTLPEVPRGNLLPPTRQQVRGERFDFRSTNRSASFRGKEPLC